MGARDLGWVGKQEFPGTLVGAMFSFTWTILGGISPDTSLSAPNRGCVEHTGKISLINSKQSRLYFPRHDLFLLMNQASTVHRKESSKTHFVLINLILDQ